MPENNLSALQAAIRKKRFSWEPGETSLSALSVEDQKARLGLAVNEAELAATKQAIRAVEAARTLYAAVAAPAAIDWRNNGGNWITQVKDQSSCGSCVSFATVGTLESRVRIACRNAALSIDLSEAHLFYCGCGNCCVPGWNFPPALDFCKNTGVGLEASFPYTPGNQPCKAGVAPYVKISSWNAVLGIADRKNVIATKGPVVAGMAVYADFVSYRSGVYRRTSNVLRGYHAVSVIGYDDGLQCWIAKNSWGTGWGESGFFKIGYGESDIDTSFAFYNMEAPCPQPPDTCSQYVPYLRRVILAARNHPGLRACLRYYVCGVGPRPLCSAQILAIVRSVVLVLRRCPQYRRPFCQAL